MKKNLFSLLICLFGISTLNAQFTKIGAGTGYSTGYYFHQMGYNYNRSGHIPLALKGIYEISLPIHISPSFAFFYPNVTNEVGSKIIVNSMMFDINGHYVFNSLDKFEFYGLAGFDILLTWKKNKYTGAYASTYNESDNALGLNLGAGTYMKLTDQLDLYGELKYILSKYDQLIFNVGVLLNIDWLIKHENPGI